MTEQSKKVKVFVKPDKIKPLLNFTRDMLRAVQMGEGELSQDERVQLMDMQDTLAHLYKQVNDAR